MERMIFAVSLLAISSLGLVRESLCNGQYGLNEARFNCIAIHPKISGLIFAGSNRNLYRSTDYGKNWKVVLNLRKEINSMLIDERGGIIYAASEAGLYNSLDQGLKWKLVYRRKDKSKNIICLAQNKSFIFLGTENGLLMSEKYQDNFRKLNSGLPESRILSIDVHEANLYIVADSGLFKSDDNGITFHRILSTSKEEIEEITDEYEGCDEDIKFLTAIRTIALDKNEGNVIYLGTDQGIFSSQDTNRGWNALTKAGLLNKTVNFILILDTDIFAATEKGLYVYDKEKTIWNEIYEGLPRIKIRHLAYDEFEKSIWIASERGIFNIAQNDIHNHCQKDDESSFSDEPTINAVQALVIEYAQVQPEKISQWRKQARLKALLPRLTFSWDKSEGNTYEIYTSSSTNYWVAGPKDKNSGWDISVSWELSDLIWSTDQTSIDVRSRLMVQLRNDILDEVTRIYFERRRLQMELPLLKIEDSKKRLEKQLRIKELTANLDAFTGGKFSKLIAKE